ncbi:hypothetical protein ACIBMZ_29165 [Micromonospora sp. NPDC049900]|uniref:hypothetical protein n=1 Tax=Micromonospora sp. NPDC049900 TaxID=3364275 RepID=UPI0037BD617E
MTKVLASAEAFGFGPASKLITVSAELRRRGIHIDVAAADAALTFARANAGLFDEIIAVNGADELAKIDAAGYDGAVSVMDPFLTIWARSNGLPCTYVDSLFWFWNWGTGREDQLQQTAAEVTAQPSALDAIRALERVPMHDSQYIAHHLSAVSCVQGATRVDGRCREIRGLGRVDVVNAVIDLTYQRESSPATWLATTSGVVNPLLPKDCAIAWIRTVARLLEEAADRSGSTAPITLAGNGELLAVAPDIASARIKPEPMSHDQILIAMNGAIGCLTPPGLTTMMECAAYGVPFILLPEQHYGHISNFGAVTGCGTPEIFPHGLVDPDGSAREPADVLSETLQVAENLRRHFENKTEVWTRMVEGIADGMRAARAGRERLRAAQEAAMREFVGAFTGAGQVADVIESLLPEHADPARH